MAGTEIFVISLLSIIILAIQVFINFYLEWRRQEKEDKRLEFERHQHKEQLEVERKNYELNFQRLEEEKNQNLRNYQNKVKEIQMQTLSAIGNIKELGIDFTKGNWEGQVQEIVKRASESTDPNERLKKAKEKLKEKRQSKK